MDDLTMKRRAMKGYTQIEKMLVASTAHVTEEEARAFDQSAHQINPTMIRDEGWLFHVGGARERTEMPWLRSGGHPPGGGFKALLERAHELGCDWLMLDRDADPLDDIEIHDW